MQIHYLINKVVKYLTIKENITVVHGVIYIVDYLIRNEKIITHIRKSFPEDGLTGVNYSLTIYI